MTSELRQLIETRIAAEDNNAAIKSACDAADVGYVEVSAISVAQWLGENALREKIDQFLALPLPAPEHASFPLVLALRAGLKQLLVAQTNPNAKLGISPESGNRALLEGAKVAGVVDDIDYAGLMSRARPGYTTPTDEQIDAIRAEVDTRVAMDARRAQAEPLISALESWIVNGGMMPTWGGAE